MKNLLLLKSMSLFLLFTIGSLQYTSAQSYKYLRFSIDEIGGNKPNPDVHIKQIRWKMGNTTFPVSSLDSFKEGDPKTSENEEVILKASFSNFIKPAHKAFENDGYETYISKTSEKDGIITQNLPALLTLEFKKAPIYATGLEITLGEHNVISKFRCYGSNDGNNWVTIYTSPTLSGSDYVNNTTHTANFGNSVPGSADTQAPSTPSGLSVGNISNLVADINWNASIDTGVGVLLYEIFVDGQLWQTSNTNTVSVYGLSKQSNYTVQVKSVDAYGNRSSLSGSQSISTGAYPEAVRKIDVGTGIGHSNGGTGIFKTSPNFGADWRSQNESTGPFSQGFINDMKKFSHIRFMDVLGTNYNKIENWTDRIQANDPKQIQKYHGDYEIINQDVLSYEWAIYLCNVTNRDMWLNVPANANENYIRSLATLVKNNLNSNLKIYLENGNETWGGFAAFDEYKSQGQNVGFGSGNQASHRYMVYKTLNVFKWFKANMGAQQNMVITVLAGQMAVPGVSRNHLAALKDQTVYSIGKINPDNVMPDLYAVAPYFDIGGDANDDGYTKMKKNIDVKIALTQEHYNIWNPENVELTCYEGGIHDNDGLRSTYSHNKGIYNTYLYYLDQLAPYYTVFSQYSYTFGGNNGNNFGAIDFVGQSLVDAPKIRALFDWIDINKNNELGNVPPVFFSDPKNITVPSGVTDVTFAAAALAPVQSYEWYKNNTSITGEDKNKYTTDRVSQSDNGTQYKTKATNAFGSTFSSSATLTVVNHHLDVSKATTAPTIDGSVDGMWSSISSQNIANANKGTTSGNADLSGNFKTTWDANNLYLLVQVTDDILIKDVTGADGDKYNYDGIEIYINDDNAYTDSYNNDAQFVYNWEGDIHSFSGGKPIAGIQVGQSNVANGYIMEVAIPWTTFGVTPQNGSFIGFDIMIADKDIPGDSDANEKKAWHTNDNISWKDPREFASVKLTDGTSSGTAPTITSQPTNVSVSTGSNATFTVTASGSGLNYQWHKGSTAINGATSNSITISTVSAADVGDYHVVVSNTEGSVTSNIVTLTINSNPGTGSYRYLKLTLNDYNNLSLIELDWITSSGSIPSSAMTSNNSGGVIASSNNNNNFIYKIFDDTYGSSDGLWIGTGLSPREVTVDLGANTATPTAIKMHKLNWAAINGFKAEGSVDGTTWDLLLEKTAADAEFSTSSDGVSLKEATFNFSTSSTGPVITSQPSNVTLSPGSNAAFSVTATGNGLSYQWFKDATAISGATSSTLTINSVSSADAGDYHVVVSNAEGSVTSSIATLSINSNPGTGYRYLKITLTDYSNLKLLEADWLSNSGSVPTAALTSNNSSGVIVTEGNFNVYDDSYTSTTGQWIGSGTTPSSVTIDLGSSSATPNAIKLYKWSWGTINAFRAEGSNDASSWDLLVEKTNINGDFNTSSVGSGVTEATFNFSTSSTGPIITSQPSDVTLSPGSNATFSVTATGGGLSYQWFKDVTAISGATSSTLTINSVSSADAGDYHVIVSNIGGSVTSNTAILTVTGYRYLKFTVNDYNNFSIREIDWVTASGSVPASAMTSNNSVGVIASNSDGWSNAYTVFDEVYDNNGYWIGNGTTPKYVTIDLGSSSAAPTAIKIYKSSWATLNGFKAEGTNDLNGTWDLLLSETIANGAFTTSSTAANVVEATFNFNGTASKIEDSKINFDDIKVFPNPVTRFLNVNIPTKVNGKLMMSLISITGKVIFRKEIRTKDSNLNQIDFSRLATGLYLLEFRDDSNISQHKIIKH